MMSSHRYPWSEAERPATAAFHLGRQRARFLVVVITQAIPPKSTVSTRVVVAGVTSFAIFTRCSATCLAAMLNQSLRVYFNQNAVDQAPGKAAGSSCMTATCTAPSKTQFNLHAIHGMAQTQRTATWLDGIAIRLWPRRLPAPLETSFQDTRARSVLLLLSTAVDSARCHDTPPAM